MWTTENRHRYDRDKLRYPSDLTDAEWQLIEPLIPPAKRGGGKRTVERTLLRRAREGWSVMLIRLWTGLVVIVLIVCAAAVYSATNAAHPIGDGPQLGAYLGTTGDSGSPWQMLGNQFFKAMGSQPVVVNAYAWNPGYTWAQSVSTAQWAASIFPKSSLPSVTAIDLALPLAMTSLSADTSSITSGAHDTDYINMIQAWVNAGFITIYARLGHEMNMYNWAWNVTSGSKADFNNYNASFQHVANLIHKHNFGVTVKTVWAPGHVGNGNAKGQTFKQFFPGVPYVDIIAIDSYAGPRIAADNQPLDTTNYSVTTMCQLAQRYGLPVALPEHGASIAFVPSFTNYVVQAFQTCTSIRLQYVCYWTDAISGDPAGSFADTTARAAWRSEWAKLRPSLQGHE